MNAEQEKFVARIQSCGTQSEVLEVVNDAVLRIIGQRNEAEANARELASHCVVVVRDYENGFPCAAMLCTVCQAKLKLPESGTSPLFIHKDDCLVGKVMKEA